jgi:N-acetylmuramoyl-L-alanine amidase
VRRTIPVLTALLLVLAAATGARAATAREMYAAATARAKELREAPARGTDAPTARQFRSAVAAFEAVVRRHPTSGYADNALMAGATLALEAQRRFGDDHSRETANRLLAWLVKEYPASPLVAKAQEALKHLPETTAADAPAPPTAAVGQASRVTTPPPAPVSAPSASASPVAAREDADTEGQRAATVIRDIRRTVTGEVVRVTIELDDEVTYRTERLENPARVLFDFASTRPGPAVPEGTLRFTSDVVRQIRIGRHPNRVTRVVLDLDGVTRYSVFTLYGPYRLVVDCERAAPLPPVPSLRIAEDRIQPPPADPETPILYRPAPPASRVAAQAADRPSQPIQSRPLRVASRTLAPRVGPRPTPDFEIPVETSRALYVTSRTLAPAAGPKPRAALDPAASGSPPLVITRRFVPTRQALAWLPVVVPPSPLPWPPTAEERFAVAAARPAAADKPLAEKPVVPAERPVPPRPLDRPLERGIDKPAASERVAERPADRLPDKPSARPADRLPAPTEPPVPPPSGFSMARQLGLGASRIIIDPGHGGHDPGAGSSTLFEATLVLDVALRLEKLLQAAGSDVVMTRRTDEYIPLEERTAIANRAQGDLFLSIHANASRNRTARGVESYVLNFATTPDAEAVAARENASTGRTMSSLTEIVKAITLNTKLDESKNLARIVQRHLVDSLQGVNQAVRDHGVKQAPFVVLIGASMPSVLVEISFITNRDELRLLKTGAYRQKIAEGLFDAVRGYQKSLKGSSVLAQQ